LPTKSKIFSWLEGGPHHLIGLRVLRAAIGIMILFRIGTEGRYAEYFWGPVGMGQGTNTFIFGQYLGGLLDRIYTSPVGIYVILTALFTGAVGFIMNKAVLLSNVLLLLCFWSLEQRFPILGDGGDNITRIVLFFLLFTTSGVKSTHHWAKNWVHNLAVVTITLQLIILYTVAGLMKANGDKWIHGVALYYISQVEWFSNPGTRDFFKIPLLTTVMCYGTVFFQLYFPIAIFSRVRLLWIGVGVVMHLMIAITMGLFTFSCVMIGLEMFLLRDDEYKIFQNFLLSGIQKFKHGFYGKHKL